MLFRAIHHVIVITTKVLSCIYRCPLLCWSVSSSVTRVASAGVESRRMAVGGRPWSYSAKCGNHWTSACQQMRLDSHQRRCARHRQVHTSGSSETLAVKSRWQIKDCKYDRIYPGIVPRTPRISKRCVKALDKHMKIWHMDGTNWTWT